MYTVFGGSRLPDEKRSRFTGVPWLESGGGGAMICEQVEEKGCQGAGFYASGQARRIVR